MGMTTVAVKVVKRYSSQKVMEQFENEMSIMSQVSHNNIVRLHGIISEGMWSTDYIHSLQSLLVLGPFSPALVMEFLPYGDLKTFLKVRM